MDSEMSTWGFKRRIVSALGRERRVSVRTPRGNLSRGFDWIVRIYGVPADQRERIEEVIFSISAPFPSLVLFD